MLWRSLRLNDGLNDLLYCRTVLRALDCRRLLCLLHLPQTGCQKLDIESRRAQECLERTYHQHRWTSESATTGWPYFWCCWAARNDHYASSPAVARWLCNGLRSGQYDERSDGYRSVASHTATDTVDVTGSTDAADAADATVATDSVSSTDAADAVSVAVDARTVPLSYANLGNASVGWQDLQPWNARIACHVWRSSKRPHGPTTTTTWQNYLISYIKILNLNQL